MEIALYICLILALYTLLRIAFEPEMVRKVIHLNAFGFAISATFVLILPDILTLIAACVFFIGITLESNALLSVYAQRRSQ